ncbi:MAG TPA: hypothetical protein VI248_20365 [Kineosporiaceae bacterium]
MTWQPLVVLAVPPGAVLGVLALTGVLSRRWCRSRGTTPAVADAVAVGCAGTVSVLVAVSPVPAPAPVSHGLTTWLAPTVLGLSWAALASAPWGLVLGVGEFGMICLLVSALAEVPPMMPSGRRTVTRGGPPPASAGSSWLLLTRSPWALRWPMFLTAAPFPLGLALPLLHAMGEEILLRGALAPTAGAVPVVGPLGCAAVAAAALDRLPGMPHDRSTRFSVGLMSLVHGTLFAAGVGILPLIVAQATALALAGGAPAATPSAPSDRVGEARS